jgi:hypothetical protein
MRGRSGGVGAESVAGVREERAPVSSGVVLQLEAEAREVAAARRWSGEGKSRRGGERARPVAVGSGQHGTVWLIGGASSTMRPIRFSNRIKFISNGFKFAPNFD